MSSNNKNENSVKQNIKQQVDSAKKTTLNLEKLKKDYSLQLSTYKQAVADYTSYLQQNANKTVDKSSPNYIVIPGKKFWGTGQAGAQSVYNGVTVEKCKALCASNSKCSGATFSPDANGKAMCWLRSGEGELTPALDTDKAIIPEAKKYLLTIESANKQLIKTNSEIQKIIKQTTPLYNTIKSEGQEQNKELIQSYTQLISEREKIEEMLLAYQDLDAAAKQGDIKITQSYYSYFLLVVIAVGAIIILYKFSGIFTSDQNVYPQNNVPDVVTSSINKYYIILIIIIIIIIITSYTSIKNTASNVSNGTYDSITSMFSGISSIFSSNY